MKLSQATHEYVEMKHAMGIPFGQGTQILSAFSTYSGDIPLRSVKKWQVLGFLERSTLSDITWMLRYRILKAFFEFWLSSRPRDD